MPLRLETGQTDITTWSASWYLGSDSEAAFWFLSFWCLSSLEMLTSPVQGEGWAANTGQKGKGQSLHPVSVRLEFLVPSGGLFKTNVSSRCTSSKHLLGSAASNACSANKYWACASHCAPCRGYKGPRTSSLSVQDRKEDTRKPHLSSWNPLPDYSHQSPRLGWRILCPFSDTLWQHGPIEA